MDGNPPNINPKSNVSLAGISVDKIEQRINRTERYLEDFYKRTKRRIEDCRAEIHEYDSNHLPELEIDKELEEFLKQDHYTLKLVYAESEDAEYESDYENEDADSRKTSSESEIEEDIQRDSPDQVAGKRRPDDGLTGAKSLHQNELKIPSTTKRPKHRATTLQDLTKHSQYTHNKMEEHVFSFPELKHHLSEAGPIPPPSIPAPSMQVMESGDLELPTCADVKLFETYFVTVTDENIIKIDRKTNKQSGKLPLKSAGQMCSIRNSSCIGIIQTNSFITVASTEAELKCLYKINITKSYANICYVDTHDKTPNNMPDPSYTFGLVYTDILNTRGEQFAEKVDLVKATTTMVHQKKPQYDAQVDALDLRPFEISGISEIGALWCGGKLTVILGCSTKVIRLEKSKSKITNKWVITIGKAATDVVCVKSMVYVCVQDEGRIFLVDINGKVENENVMQGILQCRPHKVSVYGDTLLVKSFDDSRWKNIVVAKQSKYS